MVEIYYNSNQYTHTLPFLEQKFESPFGMYEALADFYEEKGYFVNSPSRSYRYQVLLDFATAVDREREKLYKEALTFDLYLRENMKTRPEFARDLSEHKDWCRLFYEKEEEQRTYLPAYASYDRKQLAKMTHLEPFYYEVWKTPAGEMKDVDGEPVYILFDYKERNPLTFEAGWTVIESCKIP
jgi:hypothetical protein